MYKQDLALNNLQWLTYHKIRYYQRIFKEIYFTGTPQLRQKGPMRYGKKMIACSTHSRSLEL